MSLEVTWPKYQGEIELSLIDVLKQAGFNQDDVSLILQMTRGGKRRILGLIEILGTSIPKGLIDNVF